MLDDDVEYAGFWVRTGATVLDTIILMFITAPVAWLIYRGNLMDYLSLELTGNPPMLWADLLLNYGLPFVYTMIVWMLWSASPGKILLGLKIVDADSGHKLTIKQSILRYVGYFPAIMVFGIGLIWVAFDKRKQGWHDKMANTVVIRCSD